MRERKKRRIISDERAIVGQKEKNRESRLTSDGFLIEICRKRATEAVIVFVTKEFLSVTLSCN